MAEISAKRRGELIRGVFSILSEHPDGVAARDVLKELEKRVPPTPFEDSMYPKNPTVRRFEKIVRFSTISPVKAGWIVKDKGTWRVTPEGLAAYEKLSDPEELARTARRLYNAWRRAQPRDIEEEEEDEPAPAATLEEAEETAWNEIRNYLAEMPPYEFQDLVAALLRAMGYHVDWVAPPGPDQGVDVIAYTDPLGAAGPRIKVQVKRRAGDKVRADDLRGFLALVGEHDVGIFVSLGGFTSEAEREARAQEKRRIMLIDVDRLVQLWIENSSAISDLDRQLLPLQPVYFLAPPD